MPIKDEGRAMFEAINMQITYAGEVPSPHHKPEKDEKHLMTDQWVVVIKTTSPGGVNKMMTTSYYTGLGLRSDPLPHAGPPYSPNTLAWERWQSTRRPVTPTKHDVMHALLMDAQYADQSFMRWALDCGYNPDSIRDLNTYQQCCGAAYDLRRLFTREQLADMREALADY